MGGGRCLEAARRRRAPGQRNTLITHPCRFPWHWCLAPPRPPARAPNAASATGGGRRGRNICHYCACRWARWGFVPPLRSIAARATAYGALGVLVATQLARQCTSEARRSLKGARQSLIPPTRAGRCAPRQKSNPAHCIPQHSRARHERPPPLHRCLRASGLPGARQGVARLARDDWHSEAQSQQKWRAPARRARRRTSCHKCAS